MHMPDLNLKFNVFMFFIGIISIARTTGRTKKFVKFFLKFVDIWVSELVIVV